jgi:DNA-binding CsgD family transcriptional regulator
MPLLGRAAECRTVEGMVEAVSAGRGGALLVLGETGIGKTSLLDHAAGVAAIRGLAVQRAAGAETEAQLPFAALHQLLTPFLDRTDDLPPLRHAALATAFGLADGGEPNVFVVGLAALALLEAAAAETPLVCLVDDAQWLDSATAAALALASRRLGSSRVGMIIAVREPVESQQPLRGLPELELRGLSGGAVGRLIRSSVSGVVSDQVVSVLAAESGGNPSALLSQVSGLDATQLAGTRTLPDPLPSTGNHLEEALIRRVRRLPDETRTLLLLLAAERAGDTRALVRAYGRLGIGDDAAGPAEQEGLVAVGERITFRHPALRGVIYGSANADERRRVHRVLAAVMRPGAEADERTWHRAAASMAPREAIARDLEEWAERMISRLEFRRAAELLSRASALTPDAAGRARRAIAAARAELEAGSPSRAQSLLAEITLHPDDAVAQAQALRLRAAIGATLEDDPARPVRLLDAARALERIDVRQARDAYLEALIAAADAGGFGRGPDVLGTARATRDAPQVDPSKRVPADLLLDGFASVFLDGHRAAAASLRAAVDGMRASDAFSMLGLGCRAAAELWDDEALRELASRRVELARSAGASSALPQALESLGACEAMSGRFDIAEAHFDEADVLTVTVLGTVQRDRRDSWRLFVSAWRGREAEARMLGETAKRNAAARGLGGRMSLVHHALCVLELGQGRYAAALSAAKEALRSPTFFAGVATLPELAEAAVRGGAVDAAAAAADRLEESAAAGGTEWGAGMLARTRALLAEGDRAESLYIEAIEHLNRCRITPQLARARLLYGEWLRRERRARDAREELREAARMFRSMGAEAFAQRAEDELHASGEHLIARNPETFELLTAQELRIAELAGDGETNREIASRLYVSPRTVEYHLRKIFKKLGVSGRVELAKRPL